MRYIFIALFIFLSCTLFAAEYTLFTELGEMVEDYDTIIGVNGKLKQGDILRFDDGGSFKISKRLGNGGTTAIFEATQLSPTKRYGKAVALRLPLHKAGKISDFSDSLFINTSIIGGLKIFRHKLSAPRFFSFLPDQYIATDIIKHAFDGHDFFVHRNKIPKALVTKAENALIRFARESTPFTLISDFRTDQLVYNVKQNRWYILDWTAEVDRIAPHARGFRNLGTEVPTATIFNSYFTNALRESYRIKTGKRSANIPKNIMELISNLRSTVQEGRKKLFKEVLRKENIEIDLLKRFQKRVLNANNFLDLKRIISVQDKLLIARDHSDPSNWFREQIAKAINKHFNRVSKLDSPDDFLNFIAISKRYIATNPKLQKRIIKRFNSADQYISFMEDMFRHRPATKYLDFMRHNYKTLNSTLKTFKKLAPTVAEAKKLEAIAVKYHVLSPNVNSNHFYQKLMPMVKRARNFEELIAPISNNTTSNYYRSISKFIVKNFRTYLATSPSSNSMHRVLAKIPLVKERMALLKRISNSTTKISGEEFALLAKAVSKDGTPRQVAKIEKIVVNFGKNSCLWSIFKS